MKHIPEHYRCDCHKRKKFKSRNECIKHEAKEQGLRIYGSSLNIHVEDTTRCIQRIFGSYSSHQCQRKRGHGEKGLYCKQHAK